MAGISQRSISMCALLVELYARPQFDCMAFAKIPAWLFFADRDSVIPRPPPGHKWKEVRHDNTVTWLVSWTENIQGQNKYIMLNPNSRIKVGDGFLVFSCRQSVRALGRAGAGNWKHISTSENC